MVSRAADYERVPGIRQDTPVHAAIRSVWVRCALRPPGRGGAVSVARAAHRADEVAEEADHVVVAAEDVASGVPGAGQRLTLPP